MKLNEARQYILARIDIDKQSGCWNWNGKIAARGYAHAYFGKKLWRCNRLSYIVFKGSIPDGLYVCHACDNKICVNPDHLWAGSQRDNIRDCIAKGRFSDNMHKRGTLPPNAKFTKEQVKEVKKAFRDRGDESISSVGRRFGLIQSTASKIANGDSYGDVEI